MNRRDTTPEAFKILLELYRQMPLVDKVRQVFEAYQTGKMLAIAGLKESYPSATDKQLWYLRAKQHLGEKLFKEVYGTLTDE